MNKSIAMSGVTVVLLILLLKIVAGDTNLPDFSDELIGYCAPYHGKVCKSYITSPQVWYSNVSLTHTHKKNFNFQCVTHLQLVVSMSHKFDIQITGRSRWRLEK